MAIAAIRPQVLYVGLPGRPVRRLKLHMRNYPATVFPPEVRNSGNPKGVSVKILVQEQSCKSLHDNILGASSAPRNLGAAITAKYFSEGHLDTARTSEIQGPSKSLVVNDL